MPSSEQPQADVPWGGWELGTVICPCSATKTLRAERRGREGPPSFARSRPDRSTAQLLLGIGLSWGTQVQPGVFNT